MIHSSSNGNTYRNGLSYDRNGFEKRDFKTNGVILDDFKDFSVVCSSSSSSNGNCDSDLIPISSVPSSSSPSSPPRYIEHRVTKMDTLAGVAIRYGVEVADIKKLNNLTTDLQMFALKTLQIPLPGRHPPSPCLSNGHSTAGPSNSEHTPPRRVHSDILDSFQSLRITPEHSLTPAMKSLRGYYGLNQQKNHSEGFEMALYSKGATSYNKDEKLFSSPSLINPPLSQHRRSRSVANGLNTEEDDLANDMNNAGKWIETLNKKHQNLKPEFSQMPEKLLKEENGSGSWFSSITGKGLALRSKVASRTNLASEIEAGGSHGLPLSSGDSNGSESSFGVRKSSSTSNLQDQQDSNNNNNSLSLWSQWSLKPDLPVSLTKPIFDGLPKPITGRKSKAALD